MKTKRNFLVIIALAFIGVLLVITGMSRSSSDLPQHTPQGKYIAGDFHQHTAYTDGLWNISGLMRKNNYYGLDWWANSEHGGSFASSGHHSGWDNINGSDIRCDVTWSNLKERNGKPIIKGDNAESGRMWRWQSLSEYSFYDVLDARKRYSDKLIIQGLEFNPPGHEHANVAIITNQFGKNASAEDLAQFEYMFDAVDTDVSGGAAKGWTKSTKTGKEKTLEALKWLQDNYKGLSYMIPTHPERQNKYSIADFRNMNNIAPDVCFGFDSQPGHHKGSNRGGYSVSSFEATTTGATWGGTGAMAARIGGLWDALLSEGRDWWLSANSDFHNISGGFFPGEYQRTYTYVDKANDAKALIAGLRSGNSWIVTGDLIDSLNFTIEDNAMGSHFELPNESEATIRIIVRDPDTNNFNRYSDYTNPTLDHIDLIAGEVTNKIDPSDTRYNDPNVSTTKVIARFDALGGVIDGNGVISTAWNELGNGIKEITHKVTIDRPMYFRLRGTNHGLNEEGETDENGNPTVDVFGENTAKKAFSDLWFYSNPIFINVANATSVKPEYKDIDFKQEGNFITITAANGSITDARLITTNGEQVTDFNLNPNDKKHTINLNGMASNIYLLSLNYNGKVISKKIQVK